MSYELGVEKAFLKYKKSKPKWKKMTSTFKSRNCTKRHHNHCGKNKPETGRTDFYFFGRTDFLKFRYIKEIPGSS